MAQDISPAQVAKRTLVHLAKQSLAPTPENYAKAYNQIIGVKPSAAEPVSQSLQKALTNAGKKNASYLASEKKISSAIKSQNWDSLESELEKLLAQNTTHAAGDVNWANLIRTLIKQLEVSHKGTTLSRKKEGLSRVLINFAKDPVKLAEKIQALINSWGNNTTTLDVEPSAPNDIASHAETSPSIEVNTIASAADDSTFIQLRNMLVRTLDLALIPLLSNAPKTEQHAKDLMQQLRLVTPKTDLAQSDHTLKDILFAIETEQENQQDIHQALIGLLTLLTKSMSELAVEDEWLSGQLTIVNDVLSKPVNILTLGNAESSLKELIHKQANLKPALLDAQDLIKQMTETFISRLVDMTETTDEYHQTIENHQSKLSNINSIDELNGLLQTVLEDTRMMGLTVQRTREEFNDSQTKVTQAEQKIKELTSVLEYINDVANEDYLTGTLNRRGMDEAFEREFSRADRHNTALCISMMDIDHFKKLNDRLGHSTGDEALTHFANIIKEVKRAPDVVARYGGEEFILILPNTEQDDAVKVIERVQRQLTKKFFMHSEERVVITFSAGVAQRIGKETPEEIIPRADAALYEAKKAGRNRVIAASTEKAELIKALQK